MTYEPDHSLEPLIITSEQTERLSELIGVSLNYKGMLCLKLMTNKQADEEMPSGRCESGVKCLFARRD